MSTPSQRTESTARACPFGQETCGEFFDAAAELSERLARRAQDFFCSGQYRQCARYAEIVSQGQAATRLAPWDKSRHKSSAPSSPRMLNTAQRSES